ncbi:MAG: DegQ family serine endoprotease [Desulfobacterales bacterium]
MSRFRLTLVVTLVAAIALFALRPAPLSARENVPTVLPNFAELARQVKPGVVNIRTVKIQKEGGPVFRHFFGNPFGDSDPFRDFFGEGGPGREFRQQSLGSGFILDAEGYIVTNNHVIEGADQIKVRLFDEREFDARIVGRDSKTDLALIKIDGAKDLRPLRLGDSDKLEVGSWVLAVGSPFGLEQTVTAGIVSAKGRFIGAGPYDDFIQTDASINPGNSGGPLLNLQGEVVGINTAIIAQGQGIGFAIPVNLAQNIIAQLKQRGSVVRGWMGVGIQDLTPELAQYYGLKEPRGVLVTQVFPGDPADKAGMKVKDVILSIDGKAVHNSRELSSTVAGMEVGREVPVKVMRDGKEVTLRVKLAERKDADQPVRSQAPQDSDDLGVRAADLNPETARRFGLDPEERGVLIVQVRPGSKADQAGMRQGDVVKEVNRVPVTTVQEMRAEYQKARAGETVLFLVKRGGAGFLVIRIPK